VDPEFSDAARQAKHQGTVLVNITVDANGNVAMPGLRNRLASV